MLAFTPTSHIYMCNILHTVVQLQGRVSALRSIYRVRVKLKLTKTSSLCLVMSSLHRIIARI